MNVTDLRAQISDIVSRVGFAGARVVLMRHGKKLAAVIPYEDLQLLERLEEANDERAIDEARAEQANEPPISHDRLKVLLKR